MSTDLSTAPEDAPAQAHADPKRPRSTIRTTLLVVLLIVAAGALWIDRRAQANAKGLHDALDKMRSVPAAKLPTIAAVHQHIGREPNQAYDHKEVAHTKVEEYHYRGVPWRKNIVYVYYRTRPDERWTRYP